MTHFECEDCGEMKEYIGNNLTRLEEGGLKFTQDVSVESFKDKFDISDKKWSTPAVPESLLEKVKEGEDSLSAQVQTYLQSGIVKMIHIMRCNRPEISCSVSNLAKIMDKGDDTSIKALYRCMDHCVGTPNRGVTLRP